MCQTPRSDQDRQRLTNEFRRRQLQQGISHNNSPPFSRAARRQDTCLPRLVCVALLVSLVLWSLVTSARIVAADRDVLVIGGEYARVVCVVDRDGRPDVVRVDPD